MNTLDHFVDIFNSMPLPKDDVENDDFVFSDEDDFFSDEEDLEFSDEEDFDTQDYSTKSFLYYIDSKLTQFCFSPQSPDDGYIIRKQLKEELKYKCFKRNFKNNVLKELIVEAMHPSRVMKQMESFDDIEDLFESMGY
ncbi:hypothetical protein ON010_g5109 [Phytophthora cinnamomi]|nr:hypothetical protein ON010_g5109 [Phytophthora cinnamomi]